MSFTAAKLAFSKATLLDDPQQDAPTRVMVDAYCLAIGVVLQQFVDSDWVTLAFSSHKLKPDETLYSTFGCEVFAAYKTIRRFCYFLEGCQFHVMTNHKTLTYSFIGNHGSYSTRETRHLAFISEYATDLCHVRGPENAATDTLFRVTPLASPPPVSA